MSIYKARPASLRFNLMVNDIHHVAKHKQSKLMQHKQLNLHHSHLLFTGIILVLLNLYSCLLKEKETSRERYSLKSMSLLVSYYCNSHNYGSYCHTHSHFFKNKQFYSISNGVLCCPSLLY